MISMKKLRINTKGCSYSDFIKLAERSGFVVFEGAKHYKVKTIKGVFITTIPRKNSLNSFTAKSIAEKLNEFGANIDIY